jgi:hypothetical protein
MAEIPSIPQLYNDIHYARAFLNAASKEDDPARQRSLAAIGQGFAQLAQVEATWLARDENGPIGPETAVPEDTRPESTQRDG